jgi:uncharacterized protein
MRSLSEFEQHELLKLARDTIVEAVCRDGLPRYLRNDGVFGERCGVFVTLHVFQRLRGCIGVVDAHEPLGSSIVRCAASAALSDPRFPRLCAEELPDLSIELSLLSVPAPIRPDALELGRHGLLVRNEAFRGLLLPQVAVEHHFTTEQFLAETCRKAGLPPTAWQLPDTEILAFTCQILSETSARLQNS